VFKPIVESRLILWGKQGISNCEVDIARPCFAILTMTWEISRLTFLGLADLSLRYSRTLLRKPKGGSSV